METQGKIYLTSYRPLRRTTAGRRAIAEYGLPPFVDDSCRRGPDFQSEFPSVTALCRPPFAPKLRVGDVIVYMTKKVGGRWLPAILEVVERFETHADAAEWYEARGLPLPSNCMVKGNPPVPLDQTSGATSFREWDADYWWRSRKHGTFLATRAHFLELYEPPKVSDEMLVSVFERTPATQNPPLVARNQLDCLQELLGV